MRVHPELKEQEVVDRISNCSTAAQHTALACLLIGIFTLARVLLCLIIGSGSQSHSSDLLSKRNNTNPCNAYLHRRRSSTCLMRPHASLATLATKSTLSALPVAPSSPPLQHQQDPGQGKALGWQDLCLAHQSAFCPPHFLHFL